MSKCDYCENDAIYQDNVWGPTSIYCCENSRCMDEARHDLFEAAMEGSS